MQAGPHLQASPQAQPVFADSALGLWHPHWQAAPPQDLHEHCVELDMVCFPFDLVDFVIDKTSVASKLLPGIEQIGYRSWMKRLFFSGANLPPCLTRRR